MTLLSPFDQQQFERVLAIIHEVFGDNALAAYLFGSAVLGGLQPESDLDVLLILQRPSNDAEKQNLVGRLLPISGHVSPQGRWRRVELTTVVAGEVKPWRFPPRFDFQYGDWLRGEFEQGNLQPWPSKTNPDLALLIRMILLNGITLFGPPPEQMLDPVPPGDLMHAMLAGIDSLRADLPSDTRNVLLTFARIWSSLATGVILSKDAAANWALARLPAEHRPVLARARAIYLGQQSEEWDDLTDRLEPHVEYVIAEIDRLSSSRVQ